MGVLDSVIAYKQLEQQQAELNRQSVISIFDAFSKAKNINILADLEKKKMKADLAQKGLSFDNQGEIVRDNSLQSPLEEIMQKYKLAESAKNVGDRGMFDAVMGKPSSVLDASGSVTPATTQAPDATGDLYTKAAQIDPFTGKETASALQAKDQIDLANKQKEQDIKGIDPMFKKQEPFFKNVYSNKQELYDILFKKDEKGEYLDEFNSGVKAGNILDTNSVASPMSEKRQRLNSIFEDVNKANELLLARNISGGGKEKNKKIGVGFGTNAKAMKKNLDEFFTQTEEALGNINSKFKKEQGNLTSVTKVGKYTLIQ
jgi:hypothetical protein